MRFSADDNNVKVLGRTFYIDGVRYMNYSASSIEFEFIGKHAEAVIWTNGANKEEIYKAWIAVFINDEETPSKRFSLDNEESTYLLYEGEKPDTVRIRIVKMSEAAFAKVGIKSITIDGSCPPKRMDYKSRKIEFIGDSITCGYGIEGIWNVDLFNTTQENPWKAFAVTTARNLNADYHLVSWSGIGIISSWVDAAVNEPLNDWLMPMLYQYTDASFSKEMGLSPYEIWDNKQFVPDLIVINLGTNDHSYTRGIKSRVETFQKEYFKFLEFVRSHNPSSTILCTLGVMGQDLCSEVEKQVINFSKNNKDKNIFFMTFDVQEEKDGIGSDWHPSEITHKKMSEKLTNRIKDIKQW